MGRVERRGHATSVAAAPRAPEAPRRSRTGAGQPLSSAPVKRTPWLLPLLCLALGLALRVPGISFLLPHQSDPDDHAVDQLAVMRTGSAEYAYSWGKYGHLVPRAMALLPEPRADAPLAPEHAAEHLAAAGADHLRARWISALLGALAVPATFLLARAWLPPGAALLAAAFAATSLLHVSFSQQARPHVPFTTLALLAVLAAVRLRRERTLANALLWSLALLLAFGTLHSAAFLAPTGLAVLLLRPRDAGRRLPRAWVLLPIGAALVSLAVFWPFLYRPLEPLTEASEDSGRFPHLMTAAMFDGGGFRVWFDALRGYDPILLVLAPLGLVAALVRLPRWRALPAEPRRDLLVALAFAVPCAATYGVFGRSFERFFLPVYPYLGLLAALALRDVAGLLARPFPRARGALFALLAAAGLALPGYAAAKLVSLRSAPDTLERAAEALRREAQAADRATSVLLHPRAFLPLVGPLEQSDPATPDHPLPSVWLRYLAAHGGADTPGVRMVTFPRELAGLTRQPTPADVDRLAQELPRFGCTHALAILPDRGGRRSRRDGLVDALERVAELVWQVPAAGAEPFAENGYQEHDMLRTVLRARSWGPRVALYRFR